MSALLKIKGHLCVCVCVITAHLLQPHSAGVLVAARMRSASRGSAVFGAEAGRMAGEKTAEMDITPRGFHSRCL